MLQEIELHHILLHRFARVVVYQLSRSGGRTAESISEDLQQTGLTYGKSRADLVKDIAALISAGSRYTAIAKGCGGFGALFFLPRIGRTM